MKKNLILIITVFLLAGVKVNAQEIGPAQQRLLDSLCKSISKIDVSKIKTKKEANDAFMNCFESYADQLVEVAKEQNVDMTNQAAMHDVGINIGKNLMKQKCGSFMQLAMKMAKGSDEEGNVAQSVTGTFKRIDNRGFNYLVITDKAGSEKSFIWLRQFGGSEKFMGAEAAKLAGKKIEVTWKDMEVYLPQANGYYIVKEIISISFL
ncbi:hypothetical protein [Mucilaginibacter celer]|uniref:DUF3347 domain-containing protein n=1 Tax=Mucilaginibacter celer TaxID=2305508 RepID=A0A494VRQ7_9SPHI|nr:hypothetical protein [Mucilaginibacter celer]AYL94003.1 hypothetical protein HYN43_001260 [Mucilaginibacter celer]